jgi:DNA-directed RNA polymerase sigma subunit (sigma70/sigma32)
VVWGRTSTEVNLLSRILLRISLAEPKAKSKKMSPMDPVEEEEKEKAEAMVEAKLRSKKENKTLERLHPRTSAIHTYYRTMLLSLMIFLIRWMTQVFQPSHV